MKSWMVTVMVAEWDKSPLTPVTVTVYTPAVPLQDRVDVWLLPRTILVTSMPQVRPEGETELARLTVPMKP